MADAAPLDRFVAEVRAAADTLGSLIVKTALTLEGSTVPVAQAGGQAFPVLIRAVKPRIVYFVASPAEATDDVLAALETQDEHLLGCLRFKHWSQRRPSACSCSLVRLLKSPN